MTGTKRYMAPEQNYGAYDYRADLYATGLVLYEAATKQFPFTGEADEIDRKKAAGDIENIDKCPEIFRNFFLKALHREVDKRYQTASEMYDELDRIRSWQYEQQAAALIAESADSPATDLARALERCRKTFRLQIDVAERINQTLFFELRNKVEKENREKLKIRLRQHYTDAIEHARNRDIDATLQELHKAHKAYFQDEELVEQADILFKEMSDVVPDSDYYSVNKIIDMIETLSEEEKSQLIDELNIYVEPFESEEIIQSEELYDQDSHQEDIIKPQPPINKNVSTGDYRILIEEASPEFLLDKVHEDIQYPHEEEAAYIYQQAQIYTQQDKRHQCQRQYRKLGAFYNRYARKFIKMNEAELVANCYTRARFSYAAANTPRTARKYARYGAVYYVHLARQLEMQRAWTEAGKSYILAADNYRYAQLKLDVEKCEASATVCYFNTAESAHLMGDLQTAYDYYLRIISIGKKLVNPPRAVLEAQKLVDRIQKDNVG